MKRRAIAEEVLEAEPNEDLELDAATLIARVKDCFNAVDRQNHEQRAFLLQFVCDLTEANLKQIGFTHFSERLLSTARKHVAKNGYGPVDPIQRGHRPELSAEKQAKVAEMFYKFSKLHSAREANKFCELHVLEETQEFVARECCRNNICGVSTAKRYRPEDVLLSTKQLTDLCEMCEDLINYEKFGRKMVQKHAEKYPDKIAPTDLLERLVALDSPLSDVEKHTALRLITDINTLKVHYELNQHQRLTYHADCLLCSSGVSSGCPLMTIVLDFKANRAASLTRAGGGLCGVGWQGMAAGRHPELCIAGSLLYGHVP